jgi:2-ketocyclohexanecarboxyl-CoA hydrolase
VCDITIAAEHAQFGQAGPRVGSFDAGFGTAYLARVIGGKRAREVWMLCRRYSAQTMYEWGLVNAVVPGDQLHAEVRRWADEILALSPTALKVVKHSFNADTESIAGISAMAFDTLGVFVGTDEAKEGVDAFVRKEKPDFTNWR